MELVHLIGGILGIASRNIQEIGIGRPIALALFHTLHRPDMALLVDKFHRPFNRVGIPDRSDEFAPVFRFPGKRVTAFLGIGLVAIVHAKLDPFVQPGEPCGIIREMIAAHLIDRIPAGGAVHTDIGVPPGTADRSVDVLLDGTAAQAAEIIVPVDFRVMGVADQQFGILELCQQPQYFFEPFFVGTPERRMGAQDHHLFSFILNQADVAAQPCQLLRGKPGLVGAVHIGLPGPLGLFVQEDDVVHADEVEFPPVEGIIGRPEIVDVIRYGIVFIVHLVAVVMVAGDVVNRQGSAAFQGDGAEKFRHRLPDGQVIVHDISQPDSINPFPGTGDGFCGHLPHIGNSFGAEALHIRVEHALRVGHHHEGEFLFRSR